jgi:hypothetical protein
MNDFVLLFISISTFFACLLFYGYIRLIKQKLKRHVLRGEEIKRYL